MPLPTSETEGRYLLALNAYRNKQFQTIYAAATAYNVNYNTFMVRSKGQPPRVTRPPNGRKLTITEEKTLEDWILSLNARGLPSCVQMVIKYMVYAKSGQLACVDNSLVKYVIHDVAPSTGVPRE